MDSIATIEFVKEASFIERGWTTVIDLVVAVEEFTSDSLKAIKAFHSSLVGIDCTLAVG